MSSVLTAPPGRFATSLDDVIGRYPKHRPRRDLGAVERLMVARGAALSERRVVVVGTNGKTSTATYLARLFDAGGLRSGLAVSPHLFRWTERAQVGGREVEGRRFESRVRDIDATAGASGPRSELRFFDLLALATAELFAEDRVDVAVFEAGIGGRLDASRCLRAPLVVLTGIDLDHTELLGTTPEAILGEKIRVVPDGGHIVAASLSPRLQALANAYATEHGVSVEWVPAEGATYLERNLGLARAVARAASRRWHLDDGIAEATIDRGVAGRLQPRRVGGVEVLVDAAHNPQGWREVLRTVGGDFVAVVSISADRPMHEFARMLSDRGPAAVVATCAWQGRSVPADELAAAIAARGAAVEVEADPERAVARAVAIARPAQRRVLAFGSAYFVPHALAATAARRRDDGN